MQNNTPICAEITPKSFLHEMLVACDFFFLQARGSAFFFFSRAENTSVFRVTEKSLQDFFRRGARLFTLHRQGLFDRSLHASC